MKKKLTAGLLAFSSLAVSCNSQSPEAAPQARIHFSQESILPIEEERFNYDQAVAILNLLRAELDYPELPNTPDNYSSWAEGSMQYHVVSLVENYPLWSRITDIQKALQFVAQNFSSVEIPVVTTENTIETSSKAIVPSLISNRYMVIMPPGPYPQFIENELLAYMDMRPAGVTATFESVDSTVSFVQFSRDVDPGMGEMFTKALTTEVCQQTVRALSGESYDQESLCNSLGRAVLAVLNGWDYQTYTSKSNFTQPSQLPKNNEILLFTIPEQMYSALQSQLV